jgi:metallo-beta-lactamase family protein
MTITIACMPSAVLTLTFLGATSTVTGSRFLLDTGEVRVLVDCGMYQGLKRLRQRNWEPFPVLPSSIDAVVLTHAHLDHSGMLPVLVRDGFTGPILATPQTAALAAIVMADAGHLQEEEAQYANERGFSKHRPALPLFTQADAVKVSAYFRHVAFDTPVETAGGVTVELRPAGHILGSSTVALSAPGRSPCTLFFSGDVGRNEHPVLCPPAAPPAADVMLVESTYGDRSHETHEDALGRLADVISRTAKRGGTVVVPSFAVDRTEVILLALRELTRSGRIPSLPVYADSPMALAVLDLYRSAVAEGDPEVRLHVTDQEDPFDPGTLKELRTSDESRSLNSLEFPSIIISASGMATGGRVLHHLRRCLPDSRCAVVLPGFQAEGTRGRLLAEGARTVKMLGRYVPVRAEIAVIDALSAHADGPELVDWLRQAPKEPHTVYVVHGEPDSSRAMANRLIDDLGWNVVVPEYGERVRVD